MAGLAAFRIGRRASFVFVACFFACMVVFWTAFFAEVRVVVFFLGAALGFLADFRGPSRSTGMPGALLPRTTSAGAPSARCLSRGKPCFLSSLVGHPCHCCLCRVADESLVIISPQTTGSFPSRPSSSTSLHVKWPPSLHRDVSSENTDTKVLDYVLCDLDVDPERAFLHKTFPTLIARVGPAGNPGVSNVRVIF